MGKLYSELNDDLQEFIRQQHVFFVATAPLSAEGHVNMSPKGLDSFRILGPKTVAYLDLTGSGIETVAHLRENGRLTIMFCAFAGRPRILRLYGQGRVIEREDAMWEQATKEFPPFDSARSVIILDVERIADACGYAVPLYEFVGQRQQLMEWADRKGPDGIHCYKLEKNRRSIDGLPGLHFAEERTPGDMAAGDVSKKNS